MAGSGMTPVLSLTKSLPLVSPDSESPSLTYPCSLCGNKTDSGYLGQNRSVACRGKHWPVRFLLGKIESAARSKAPCRVGVASIVCLKQHSEPWPSYLCHRTSWTAVSRASESTAPSVTGCWSYSNGSPWPHRRWSHSKRMFVYGMLCPKRPDLT